MENDSGAHGAAGHGSSGAGVGGGLTVIRLFGSVVKRARSALAARRATRNSPWVYTTCLFCTRPLGTNEVLERFPVGRRVAFDAATGRLWVVCPHCERWNLTPMEERWEAIEQAERRYRTTRLRISTENIGLA